MPGVFFTSWELWQQMTFVLSMAIVAVFCAGLGKLWWNNRLMKKQEVLDEEKRARVELMRKTGLPIKRANNVPFGIRAIQSGIEVDGIWISRPASLNETGTPKLASSTTLAGRDSDSHRKGREYSEDEKSVLVTTRSLDRVDPKHSTSTVSVLQKLTDSDSTESGPPTAPPLSQYTQKAKRHLSRPVGPLNEDTLRRLEGRSPVGGKPLYDAYSPATTSPRQSPQCAAPTGSQRSSTSSSQVSVDTQPRSVNTAGGRSYTSSHSSRLYVAARSRPSPNGTASGGAGGGAGRQGAAHDAAAVAAAAATAATAKRDPSESPRARTSSGFSAFSQSGSLQQQQQQQQQSRVASREASFGSGDLHFNTVSRRVNDGFEVLPAGTFGVLGQRKMGEAESDGRDGYRPVNKLRKSSTGLPSG